MRKATKAGAALGAAAVVLLAGACGSAQQNPPTTTVQPAAAPGDVAYTGGAAGAAPAAGSAAPAAAGAAGLNVRNDAKLGELVVDGQGRTLYRFDKDTINPAKSNCNDACAQAWPPVPATEATNAKIADASKLGEVTRADGTKQLTLGGWPLYRYAADSAAGQTNGQGVNNVWFAVTGEGKKIGGAAGGKDEEQAEEPGGEYGEGGGDAYEEGGEGEDLAVRAAKEAKLGDILVNAEGKAIYRFTKDVAWPMKIACVGKCAEVWPPVPAVKAAEQEKIARALGIDRKLLTNVKRPDGSYQLAIDCWPLYTYSKDTQPNVASGQGVGGTWFAVSKAGKILKQ